MPKPHHTKEPPDCATIDSPLTHFLLVFVHDFFVAFHRPFKPTASAVWFVITPSNIFESKVHATDHSGVWEAGGELE